MPLWCSGTVDYPPLVCRKDKNEQDLDNAEYGTDSVWPPNKHVTDGLSTDNIKFIGFKSLIFQYAVIVRLTYGMCISHNDLRGEINIECL